MGMLFNGLQISRSWPHEKAYPLFLQVRLLEMLDEYSIVRQEKEEEKRRARVCSPKFKLWFII